MNDPARHLALVTGGAQRVGRAIVRTLAEAGFDIAFTYLRSEAEAISLAQELKPLDIQATAIRADLTQPEQAIASIDSQLPKPPHLLINNASLYLPADLSQTSLDLSRRLMAIHYESPLLLAQRFADGLRQSRGHVINMLDLLVERPLAAYLPYCASKAALANLTLCLARELAPEVTVNGIAPGVVEWPDGLPQEQREQYLRRVPLARSGAPEDVARFVRYLCTEGNYITGQILHLDGGRSIT